MKKLRFGSSRSLSTTLTLLLSVVLLCGMAVPAAVADQTEYYNASGWVIVKPTPTPSATPTESIAPEGLLSASADGISFQVTPAADSPVFGATLSVDSVTDETVLAGARAAYVEAFGADSLTDDTALSIYKLSFANESGSLAVPADLAVTVSGDTRNGFTPSRAVPFDWRGDAASLGDAFQVDRADTAWQTTLVLPNTDMILLAARPKTAAETDTPAPSVSPEASVSPSVSPEASVTPAPTEGVPGTYTFEDGNIRLTATVGGSLPPEGATFFVESIGDAPAQDAEGTPLRALLGYRVGFRVPEGELGADAPMSVHLDVINAAKVAAATRLTNRDGGLFWSLASDAAANTTGSFDFQLAVGDGFILSGPETVSETPSPQPQSYTYEDDAIRLTVSVPADAALPEGAALNASAAAAGWETYAEALGAQGITEATVQKLLTLTVSFTADGEPVDASAIPLNCELLLKGETLTDDAQAWVIDAAAAQSDSLASAEEGATAAFTLTGAKTLGFAILGNLPRVYTYEDDIIRLDVTVPTDAALPEGAALNAGATAAEWAQYAALMQAHNFTETAVQKLLTLTVAFTADGAPVDTSALALNCRLLLKGVTLPETAQAWVLSPDAATQTDKLAQTEAGATATFTLTGVSDPGFAIVDAQPRVYTYENEAIRLSVSVPAGATLPADALLTVSDAQGDWAEYAKRLQKQGFDQTRVQQLQKLAVGFATDAGQADTSAIPLTYTLLLKGAAYTDELAWVLLTDAAVPAETFTQSEEGATAVFTATGEPEWGFAVTLPGRTVYTYEDDTLYVVATLSDVGSIPEDAELQVTQIPMSEQLQPYVDMIENGDGTAIPVKDIPAGDGAAQTDAAAADAATADGQPAQTDAAAADGQSTLADGQASGNVKDYSYAAYNIRLMQNGVECEPTTGTVNIAMQYKQTVLGGANLEDVRVLHIEDANGAGNAVELPANYAVDQGQNVNSVNFNTNGFSNYIVFTSKATSLVEKLYDGSHTGTYNGSVYTGAFETLGEPYYFSRPLGIAGNFGLVAFGTVTSSQDVNSNILADNINVTSNIGTKNITNEITYLKNITNINGNFGTRENATEILTVGSSVPLTTYTDQNGTKTFQIPGKVSTTSNSTLPNLTTAYIDVNTDNAAFINLATVHSDMLRRSASLGTLSDTNTTAYLTSDNNYRVISLNSTTQPGVYNISAGAFNGLSGNNLYLRGFSGTNSNRNNTLLVNINCSGFSGTINMPPKTVMQVPTATDQNGTEYYTCREVTGVSAFGYARIIWNFVNCSSSVTINAGITIGTILAPDATLNLQHNFNGTAVAKNIAVSGECHRDDFIGSFPTTYTSVTVAKTWNDAAGNTLSTAPTGAEVVVNLYGKDDSGTTQVTKTATLNATSGWSASWSGLDGSYTYTAEEVSINGVAVSGGKAGLYTVSYTGNGVSSGTIGVVNQKIPTTTLTINKNWLMADGSTAYTFPGTKPSVTLQLKRGTTASDIANYGSTFTVTGAEFPKTISDLPTKNDAGTAYTYYVTEVSPFPGGFVYDGTTYGTTTVDAQGVTQRAATLSNRQDTVEVKLTKTWSNGSYTGTSPVRPRVAFVLSNGVSNVGTYYLASGSTTLTIPNLPKGYYSSAGVYSAYTYSLTETTPTGYTAGAVTTTDNLNFAVTNTLVPTSFKVYKTWAGDTGYETAYRKDPLTLTLQRSTTESGSAAVEAGWSQTVQVTASGSWSATVNNLLPGKYVLNATTGVTTFYPYTYSVIEESVYAPANYTAAQATTANANDTVLNTFQTVNVKVTKAWMSAENTGTAAAMTTYPAVTVRVFNSAGTQVDSGTISANASNLTWTSKALPKYDTSGNPIAYTVKEDAVTGFTPSATSVEANSGNNWAVTMTNTRQLVSVSGDKKWFDESGNRILTGAKHPAFTVTLYQGSAAYVPSRTKSFAVTDTDLTYTFANLPKYDLSGNLYAYSVRESSVTGFTPAYPAETPTDADNDITAGVTNTLNKVSLTVNKQWLDNGTDVTAAATRDVAVQLTRKADNETAYTAVAGKTATLRASDTPSYQQTFSDLPAGTVDSSGAYHAYTYSVTETALSGYTPAVGATTQSGSAQSVTVTNTRILQDFTVTKKWLAADGTTAVSAPSGATVTVQLMQNLSGATPAEVSGKSVVLNGTADTASDAYESAAWVAAFKNLPQFTAAGEQIFYSAKESASTNAAAFWCGALRDSDTAATLQNRQTALYVSKAKVGGAALAGAAFVIKTESDGATLATLTGSSLTSDWTQYGLNTDTVYRLTETVIPKGYLPAQDVLFKIKSADGKVYTSADSYASPLTDNRITVTDSPISLNAVKLTVNQRTITQTELNALSSDQFVTGAVLKLFASDDASQTNALQTITVSDKSFYALDATQLEYGKTYKLVETTTPAKYKTADPLTFTVGADVSGTIYVLYDEPLTYRTIQVEKTWASGSTPVAVTFDLYMGAAKTLVDTVILPANSTTGIAVFDGSGAPSGVNVCIEGKYPTADAGGTIAYTVTERTVPGYVTSAVTQTSDTATLYNAVTNTPIKVTFSKTSLLGSDELPGATLTLTDITENQTGTPFTETWTSGTTPHEIIGALLADHTYTLAETTAPNGYAVTETVSFKVNADGTITAVSTPANTAVASGSTGNKVTMRDKQLTLTVSKMETGDTTNKLLSGASITLTDTTAGKEVGTWSSTGSAKVFQSTAASDGAGGLTYTYADPDQVYPLIAGHSYKLTENSAPSGYIKETASLTFTVATDGSLSNVSSGAEYTGTALTLRNRINTLTLQKTGALNAVLPGATFEIYLYSDTAANHRGTRVFADQTTTTGSDGTFTIKGLVNGQKYVLHETVAPAGYDLAPDTVLLYQDSLQSEPTASVTVADTVASFKVRKTDADGNPLADASLGIYSTGGKLLKTVASVAASTGNPNGWVTVQADIGATDTANALVKGGTYILKEITPPPHYTLSTAEQSFVFSEGGTVTLTVANTPLELFISKRDIVGGAEIDGATLTLTDSATPTAPVDTWQTAAGTDGVIKPHQIALSSLIAGHTYTLTETTAPNGYVHAESVTFVLNADGTVTLSGTNGSVDNHTVIMTDDRTSLTLVKTGLESANLSALAGFTLNQSDASQTMGAQVGSEGLYFDRLVPGAYYWLTETKVPEGYVAMAPLFF